MIKSTPKELADKLVQVYYRSPTPQTPDGPFGIVAQIFGVTLKIGEPLTDSDVADLRTAVKRWLEERDEGRGNK